MSFVRGLGYQGVDTRPIKMSTRPSQSPCGNLDLSFTTKDCSSLAASQFISSLHSPSVRVKDAPLSSTSVVEQSFLFSIFFFNLNISFEHFQPHSSTSRQHQTMSAPNTQPPFDILWASTMAHDVIK